MIRSYENEIYLGVLGYIIAQGGVIGADGLQLLAFSETVTRFLALKITVSRFFSFRTVCRIFRYIWFKKLN